MSTTPYLIPKLEICSQNTPSPLSHTHCFRVEEDIKRSRFITSFGHADSRESAKLFIDKIRAEFPDATHNCWAYAVGMPKDTAQIGQSDDGEPHGTAGRPMLNILLHGDVGECVVVVTRYFGGTLLGTGGLIRAYQGCTANALAVLPSLMKIAYATALVQCPYDFMSKVHHVLPKFQANILQEDYGNDVTYTIKFPETNALLLEKNLIDIAHGNIDFLLLEGDS